MSRIRFNNAAAAVIGVVGFAFLLNLGLHRVTAQAGESSSKDPFVFIVYGDTRSHHDVHREVTSRILAEKPDFVLHTGDMVANGLDQEDWDKFFEIEKDLLRNIPFYPTLGNHDRNAPAYFKHFTFPNGDGHHYSFDRGDAHFSVIDSNSVGDNCEQEEAFLELQLSWLREDLLRSQKALRFVMLHHPLYTVIERRKGSAAKRARRIEPVLAEGAVTAVFSGHDHNYQHHIHGGIHYIVTGGGGAPLYDISPGSDTVVRAVKIHNYVRVHVKGNKANVEALDLTGGILDSFELQGEPRTSSPVTGSLADPVEVDREACAFCARRGSDGAESVPIHFGRDSDSCSQHAGNTSTG